MFVTGDIFGEEGDSASDIVEVGETHDIEYELADLYPIMRRGAIDLPDSRRPRRFQAQERRAPAQHMRDGSSLPPSFAAVAAVVTTSSAAAPIVEESPAGQVPAAVAASSVTVTGNSNVVAAASAVEESAAGGQVPVVTTAYGGVDLPPPIVSAAVVADATTVGGQVPAAVAANETYNVEMQWVAELNEMTSHMTTALANFEKARDCFKRQRRG